MNYKTLFLISLGLNIGMGFYAFRKSVPAPETAAKMLPSNSETNIAKSVVKVVEPTITNTVNKQFGWESVESSDYRQYIANLRSVGCPEETIRDIIRADVIKLYDQKKKRVRTAAPKFEYWKGDEFIRGIGRDAWMKMLALDGERDGVLRTLGIEPDYSKQMAKKANGLDWMLDFLGDDSKKAQILRLNKELEDRLAVRTENLDASAIELLIKEKDAAVKRLLTPEEALQYDLRMSPAAATLRNRLGAFEPTEQEFISLYKLQRTLDETLPATNPDETGADRRAKRQAAEQQVQEQIRQTLGAERYADYEIAQDHTFQQMYQAAKQAGLGASEAKQIYGMRKSAEEHATRIRSDQGLPAEQRSTALEGVRLETERAMHTVLGEKGWEQFRRGGNNAWLDTIHARPVGQNGSR
jgi:hypothetical protein